jgi:hypothetical protein
VGVTVSVVDEAAYAVKVNRIARMAIIAKTKFLLIKISPVSFCEVVLPTDRINGEDTSTPKEFQIQIFRRVSIGGSGKRARDTSWGLSASNTTRTNGVRTQPWKLQLLECAYSIEHYKKEGGQQMLTAFEV